MSNRLANIVFSTLLITGAIVFIQIARQFENLTALAGAQVPTQMFPIAVLCILILCASINLAKYVLPNGAADADQPFDMDFGTTVRVVGIIIILIVTTQIWDHIGFVPASVFSTLSIAAVLQVRSALTYACLAAYGPLTWAFFRYAVNVNI